MQDDNAKVYALIEDFDTAMLITQGDDGTPHARPMAVASVEPNCNVWFFTGRSSAKVQEIRNDQRVLLVFQDEHSRYITLAGRAELVVDRAKAQQLWNPHYQAWFPGGPDDPDLLLIYVHADEAEYWDNSGAKGVRYLFETARAVMRGTRPDVKEGQEHGRVSI
jgi:general stress protein 26